MSNLSQPSNNNSIDRLSPEEASTIAKEAYVYGFPLVDSYRIQHAYFIDTANKEYKAPFNTLVNMARVYTPEDKAVQTPNSDTPYSMIGMDLRTEPLVLTVPEIEQGRYYSIQLIDAYTHNFEYIGSRATGNHSGHYVIAGPGWKGETPPGVDNVIKSETEFALAVYRTQLFEPADLDNVKKIQQGYKLQPLSTFLGEPASQTAPAPDFVKPLSPEEQKTSIEFFNVLNFILKFCPTVSSEKALMDRFARIGVGGDEVFDVNKLTSEIRLAFEKGINDAWKDFAELKKLADSGKVTSGDIFGNREFLKNNYLYRMSAAIMGIYGNSKQEAMYPVYFVDADNKKLDGASSYTVRFEPGQLPPVNGFWSMTMYELPSSLLINNPINRYLINSPMLPQLKKDEDGGYTVVIQHQSPGKDKEANWLPAPEGPFFVAMRLYWPKDVALNGSWKKPPMQSIH
jgi:hypothetical protein